MIQRVLIIGLIISLCTHTYAQEIDLQNFIEQNFQLQDQDINYEDIYESLFIYYTKPININRSNYDQLASLYLLSPEQITQLLNYREAHGSLISVYELQVIPSWDLATIHKVLPFITVGNSARHNTPLVKRIQDAPTSYLLLRQYRRIELAEGYTTDNGYTGSPDQLYARLRISNPDDFSFGFTLEKDAGEQLAWNSKVKGVDYQSAHLQIQEIGPFKNTILGDYQLQYGQGLVLGAGFSSGKGSETILTTRRGNAGLRPFGSVIESGFFRGLATTVRLKKLEITPFYSRTRQDGNRISDSTYSDFEEFVNGIQATGFHRTNSELENKDAIQEQSYGMAALYHPARSLNVGMTTLKTHYDTPIQKKPNNYNQYEFSGSNNSTSSFFINYNWQNFFLFGEGAISTSKGKAIVGGVIATITPKVDFSMVGRSYAKDFHSFYGNSFSESSRIINEQGIYWGLKVRASKRHQIAAYYDRFYFPWLRYQAESPTDGNEWLIRYSFVPSRNSMLYLQVRNENKELTQATAGDNLSSIQDRNKQQLIVNYDTKLASWLFWKTRIQYSHQNLAGTKTDGITLIQDLIISFTKWKFSTRFALFDTDDYDNRQYAYEKNVLYAFSIPSYSGRGIRQYALLEYRLNRMLTFYTRYSRFDYQGVSSVGSGLNKTPGNRKSEIISQLRIRF